MDPFATHQEALMAALAAHSGDVLELGCSHFSTPIIRAVTKATGAKFVIASSGKEAFDKFRDQCDEFIVVADWRKWTPEREYAVCLLDNEQTTWERYQHFPALLGKCRCVVVHDADRYAKFPGWPELLDRTPHTWYRKYLPHTVVLTPGKHETPVVLVCRSGGDFSPAHVPWLARQLPGRVSVLTDFPAGQFAGMEVIPLKYQWPGWWAKMELFRPDILGEPFLYLDLDTVVRAIPANWYGGTNLKCVLPFRNVDRLQSGVMMLPPGAKAEVWDEWIQDPAAHMKSYRGDQDFIAAHAKQVDYFPLEDVSSWKFTPERTAKAKVVCFHGTPRPWDCGESWVPPLQPPPIAPGESCILVGNGPSLLSGTRGLVIDAFDHVVRFNTFKTTGLEPHTGSKTTLWATFGGGTLPQDDVRPSRVLMVHQGGTVTYEPAAIWNIPHSFYAARRMEIQAASMRECKVKTGLIPSTGFLTARWLLENGADKITLVGFDHFSRATTGQHHYWDARAFIAPPEHDGDAEARLLLPLVKSGRLIYLR